MTAAPLLVTDGSTDEVGRSARLGLAAICLGFLMVTLDATIVNVALGPIVADLGGSLAAAQWIVNGYTIAFAALLLSAGALGDRLGTRRGFLIGLAMFGLSSAACATAGSLAVLVAARVVQGVGAAWLMPSSLALITHTFPEGRYRRRALAVWGGSSGVGLAAGPILGGILASTVGWRAIFLVNVPVAAVAAVLLVRHTAETRRHGHPLDLTGQALAAGSLSALAAGFIVAGQHGWLAAPAIGLIGAGVVVAAAFVVAEHRVTHPMVDPSLFRRRSFALSVGVGTVFNFCLYGALFCLAIGLHDRYHLGPLEIGMAILPMTVICGTAAFLTGRSVARFGEWPIMAAGMAGGALGAIFVAVAATSGHVWVLVVATLPLGLTAMAMPAMTAAAMAAAPAPRVGLFSGALNAARQTGGALGVAVLGALLHHGANIDLRPAFAAIACIYLVGVLLAISGHNTIDQAAPTAITRGTAR